MAMARFFMLLVMMMVGSLAAAPAETRPESGPPKGAVWNAPGFTATRNPMAPRPATTAAKPTPAKLGDPFEGVRFTGVVRGGDAAVRAFLNGELRKSGDLFTVDVGGGKSVEVKVVSIQQKPPQVVLSIHGKEKAFSLNQ